MRFFKIWLTIGWILILAVIFLSLSPKPPDLIDFEEGDKVGHVAAYLTLTVWFSNLYGGNKERIKVGAGFVAMGAVLEVLQGMTGYRTFQYTDIAANAAGVFLGWFLVKKWFGFFIVRLENLIIRLGI